MIEVELQEMLFGYDREILEPAGALIKFGPEHALPVITNNEKVVSGDAIPDYLKELHSLMEDWQAFQSSCSYINGEDC